MITERGQGHMFTCLEAIVLTDHPLVQLVRRRQCCCWVDGQSRTSIGRVLVDKIGLGGEARTGVRNDFRL